MMVSGGELAIRTLKQAGVERIFALYGGHLEALFQACREHGLPVLDVRHEVAGGHAAEGYARAKRSLAVAFATAGPGFTNVVTSITNAYLDRTPVVYISASVGVNNAEINMVQGGVDQVAIARPITKWAHRVTATADIPRLLAHAIRVATAEPTGPVLLDIPIDISLGHVEEDQAPIPKTIQVNQPVQPRAEAVATAIGLLAQAKRPVIMAGEGAYWSDAGEAIRALAERIGAPVFTDYAAMGLMPDDHPLDGGVFYRLTEFAEEGHRPDVVLALGVRFGVFTVGGAGRLFPKDAKIIHVETDPREIGRLMDVDAPIVADPRETALALDAAASGRNWPDLSGWASLVREAKARRRQRYGNVLDRKEKPIHPYQVTAAVMAAGGEGAIYIGDGAEAHHWLVEAMRRSVPGRFFTHGMLGATGMGTGLALGVQLAHPGERVICLTGDGALGFTIAEFDTMVRHGLPIVMVVMNNRSWGATQRFQDMLSGPGKNIAVILGDARYDQVAEGFGAHGEYVTDIADLSPALERALASGKPACVNVEIDLAEMPPETEVLITYGG